MRTRAWPLPLAAWTIAVSLAIACTATGAFASTGGKPAAKPVVVTLKNIEFHPGAVHIKTGQSVTWMWEDADIDTQHNVTSIGSKHFKSSKTQERGTYTVTFNAPGTYDFECTIHPQTMQGKVIVNRS
jgi:plastocyanin